MLPGDTDRVCTGVWCEPVIKSMGCPGALTSEHPERQCTRLFRSGLVRGRLGARGAPALGLRGHRFGLLVVLGDLLDRLLGRDEDILTLGLAADGILVDRIGARRARATHGPLQQLHSKSPSLQGRLCRPMAYAPTRARR